MTHGTDDRMRAWLCTAPLRELTVAARARRDARGPARSTYSRKVFIPLTRLCADVCHYCTFATAPSQIEAPYLSPEQVLEIARAGAARGCREALFTLGDAPERRYRAAADALAALGFARTIDYVVHVARLVRDETGLLPHINAGILSAADYALLRPVAASMGLMLESASDRLCQRGQAHFGSPDKVPAVRLASLDAAGAARVPMTSGILIGIGETADERIDALFALRDCARRHGHLQEVIVQNFAPKAGTRMANAAAPTEADFLRAIAWARLILDDDVSVQAPPNLNEGRFEALLDAGIDDWGGISPVTIDHVNPEAPWPEIARLADTCAAYGRPLVERLTIYPRFITDREMWIDAAIRPKVLKLADAEGLAREGGWAPGTALPAPGSATHPLGAPDPSPLKGRGRELPQAAEGRGADRSGILLTRRRAPPLPTLSPAGERGGGVDVILAKALRRETLDETEIVALFAARGGAAREIVAAADALRAEVSGEAVTYVVNRNINYTNICTYSCAFCAFSKTSTKAGTRDKPYRIDADAVAARAVEAWDRGATEVCLQGGIHPSYTGNTYLEILRAVKAAVPAMHVHAFSPLEVASGAATLGLPVRTYLAQLKEAGLGSLPGTAAEILDDEVRAHICPDKLSTAEWLDVVRAAHEIGLPTTATIMFGHLDRPEHWARHLRHVRALQLETGGFTEFVPLPFVHMEAPLYRRGHARQGPTWRETILMHAIARLALNGAIGSIQCSWVKLGLDGAAAALAAGCNDLGGVLINESISRAAGADHGQEVSVADLRATAAAAGRTLRRRSTLYRTIDEPEFA